MMMSQTVVTSLVLIEHNFYQSVDVIKGQNPCMEARPSQDESLPI